MKWRRIGAIMWKEVIADPPRSSESADRISAAGVPTADLRLCGES